MRSAGGGQGRGRRRSPARRRCRPVPPGTGRTVSARPGPGSRQGTSPTHACRERRRWCGSAGRPWQPPDRATRCHHRICASHDPGTSGSSRSAKLRHHDPWVMGGRVKYETVAEAYRDLEAATGRLALIDRMAELIRATPDDELARVCYLCQGLIAPAFAGIDLGLAEKLAIRAVATAAGVEPDAVTAAVRERGDLGEAAEALLPDRAPSLTVGEVVETLHEIAAAEGAGSQGRKLDLLAGLLGRATPLEARYVLRLVTGNLRLGIGTPTILDALVRVHAGGKADRPVLERAYNICCDLGVVAETLARGGLSAIEVMQVHPGKPVRVMLAQRLSEADEILARLGGECAAEYKYDGVRIQAHRTADGQIELFTRGLERINNQFPDLVEAIDAGLGPREAIL